MATKLKHLFLAASITTICFINLNGQSKDDMRGYLDCIITELDEETLNRIDCDLIRLRTESDNCNQQLQECLSNCRESNTDCFQEKRETSRGCRNTKRNEIAECKNAKKNTKAECKTTKNNRIEECKQTLRGREKRQCKKIVKDDFTECKKNLKEIKKRCKEKAKSDKRNCIRDAKERKDVCLAELEDRISNCRSNCGDCEDEREEQLICENLYNQLAPRANVDHSECVRIFLPGKYNPNCDSGMSGDFGTTYSIRNQTDQTLTVYVFDGFNSSGSRINSTIISTSLGPNLSVTYTIECGVNLTLQGESLTGLSSRHNLTGTNCCSFSNTISINLQ